MSKPSIFSSEYEREMKRRRTNIILIILIIVCGLIFGTIHFLDSKGIDIFEKIQLPKVDKKPQVTEKVTSAPTAKPTAGISPSATPAPTTTLATASSEFQYALSDGKVLKIQYDVKDGVNVIKGMTSDEEKYYNISPNGDAIVFVDDAAHDVIMVDSLGKATKISQDSYKSKSAKITITKSAMIKKDPAYVWAAKPCFTSDGRIAMLTDLPYIKNDNALYVWVKPRTGGYMRMIGKLPTKDVNAVNYGGLLEDGSLKITVGTQNYYLKPKAVKLTR